MRFAMSCASSFAVDVVAAFGPLVEDSAVSGLSWRMDPIRRTISGHEMVWMSAWQIWLFQSVVTQRNKRNERLVCAEDGYKSCTCLQASLCRERMILSAICKMRWRGGRKGVWSLRTCNFKSTPTRMIGSQGSPPRHAAIDDDIG